MTSAALCSEEQTQKFAAAVARLLKPGDTVFLIGPLGAGKTFFIRAAARELGVTEPVTSPSFTMAQTYQGMVTVHHLDLYRLATFSADDFPDFDPFFEADAITFIEWPQQAQPFLQEPALVLELSHVDVCSRRIRIAGGRKELIRQLEEEIAGTGD